MICKWILPDSSVYYAVTLVSSDAVWLLSHLTVKKGSWVRGMDCAVSALVTQIVQTLQRNKCNCGCTGGMWKIHFLWDTRQKGRGYGSSAGQSLDVVFSAFMGQRVKWRVFSYMKEPKVNLCTSAHHWLNPYTQVLILCVTEMNRRLGGEFRTR